jgi:hypothetical protein
MPSTRENSRAEALELERLSTADGLQFEELGLGAP